MNRDVDELISGYLDESLTEDEQRELSAWIKADEANAKRFAKAVMLHDRLQGEISAAAETQSVADKAEESKIVPFPFSGVGTRVVQLAAVLVLMLAILYWPTGPKKRIVEAPQAPAGFATLAHAVDAQFDGLPVTIGQRMGAHTIALKSGLLRLQFDSGVEVTLQGPAQYQLISSNRTKLTTGLLTANVSPGAEGFRVDTPTAEVTDLGTSFGVHLRPDGASHVSVFDGEVEVAEPDSGEKKLLKEGEEIVVTSERKLEAVKFDATPYEKVWPISTGIAGSTGAFELAPPWPRRLGLSAGDDKILVVPDGYRRRIRFPLKVNISAPGKVETQDQLTPAVLPPGAPLRSFILFYQPRENLPRRFTSRIQGSITFDRPIAGVIVLHKELRDSGGRFSSRKVGMGQPRKQVDLFGSPASDVVTLSHDRKTLSVDLAAPGKSADVIRVVVDAAGPRRMITL